MSFAQAAYCGTSGCLQLEGLDFRRLNVNVALQTVHV